jgi:hypothetical protein
MIDAGFQRGIWPKGGTSSSVRMMAKGDHWNAGKSLALKVNDQIIKMLPDLLSPGC